MKIAYLCDQKVYCSKEAGCAKNGGSCKHTCDIKHAKNFAYWPAEQSHDGIERAMEDPDRSIRREDYVYWHWPEITADTPIEEIIRIHRLIWDYAIEYGCKPYTPYEHDCAFCEYGTCIALQKENGSKCEYCLGSWGNPSYPDGSTHACERNHGLYRRWLDAYSKESDELAAQIRDIPIRKDIFKEA